MSQPAVKAQPAARRGPGRPPSKPAAPPLARRGIVGEPSDPMNRLEFVYESPTTIKSIFTFLKHNKVQEIHLRCSPEALTFFARDSSGATRIVAAVAGRHVNWHYCSDTFWLGISNENISKVAATIDKHFYKITITYSHTDPNHLTFTFKNDDLSKDCIHKVQLSTLAHDEELIRAEETMAPEKLTVTFPLEFTLPAKDFKKTVIDAISLNDKITIEKIGRYPLQLAFVRPNHSYSEVYRDDSKIRFRSTLGPDDVFRCTVALDNIKSVAASSPADLIRILCREDGDILMRPATDDVAITISALTKIIP